jgi:hypothetical protein
MTKTFANTFGPANERCRRLLDKLKIGGNSADLRGVGKAVSLPGFEPHHANEEEG